MQQINRKDTSLASTIEWAKVLLFQWGIKLQSSSLETSEIVASQ